MNDQETNLNWRPWRFWRSIWKSTTEFSKIHNHLMKSNDQPNELKWWMTNKLKSCWGVEPTEMDSKLKEVHIATLTTLRSLRHDHLEEWT